MSRPLAAAPRPASIEIDARAEALIDPRAVRRLVQLELADVDVRPAPGQRDTVLFVRVLGAGEGQLRIELWERGVAYGSRIVAGATASAQLGPRRVALAAAELARELRDERDDAALEAEEQRKRALDAARVARNRTREGPRALRSGFIGMLASDLALAGTSLAGELTLYRNLRLDLGAGLLVGGVDEHHAAQGALVQLGPARRLALGRAVSLDGGFGVSAYVFNFPNAHAVDGIAGQHQTWSASLDGRLRLEPRLSRTARLVLGFGGGIFLREMPVEIEVGDERRIQGLFATAELALVITPF
jgi:hypothetical protein